MANAQKVANIFELASAAFKKMADLTIDLKIFQTQAEQGPTTSSRWTIIEVEALKDAVARFGNDLNKIASMIETKTITQIKHKLKTQALEGPVSEPVEGDETEDTKNVEELCDSEAHITELPPVSTVSVDRGRRKQNFSGRSDFEDPETKKRRLDSSSSVPVVRPAAPLIVRPSIPIQRLPVGVPPTPASVKPRVTTPSASTILSHAHMRKQAMRTADSKYEDYSDFEGEDPYEDVHNEDDDDDDDDDVSDEPYYSEEEGDGGSPDGDEGDH